MTTDNNETVKKLRDWASTILYRLGTFYCVLGNSQALYDPLKKEFVVMAWRRSDTESECTAEARGKDPEDAKVKFILNLQLHLNKQIAKARNDILIFETARTQLRRAAASLRKENLSGD